MTANTRAPSRHFLARVLDLGTRPPVLTAFAILQAGILVSLGMVHLATMADPGESFVSRPAGDYAAFYTGAALVERGRGEDLFDLSAQHAAQLELLGDDRPYWQPYLNPPALALALSSTADLGFVGSFRVFALASLLLLLLSLAYLTRATPKLSGTRTGRLTILFLTLGYLPVAVTTFGGQNTGLTLALLAFTFAAARLEHTVLAGLFLGLLTYKPQFALMIGLVFLFRGQFKIIGISALVAAAHYGLGAWVCGPAWPLDYLSMLGEHMPTEMAQNGPWHISLPPLAGRLFPVPASTILTAAGAVAILLVLAKTSLAHQVDSRRFPTLFALAVLASMLLSPHLQYYDLGIIALPAILCIETHVDGIGPASLSMRALLAAGYLSYPAWQLSEPLGVQPLFFLILAVFVWSMRLASK
jgi:hypothetical protein